MTDPSKIFPSHLRWVKGNTAAKRVEKQCCEFYWPTFKPVLQQIRLLQVAWILTSDWTRLRGSHAIDWSDVTCCKTSSSWAGKTCNMYRFCCKKVELLATFCTIFSQPATTRFVGRQVWTANKTNCLPWENSLPDYHEYEIWLTVFLRILEK